MSKFAADFLKFKRFLNMDNVSVADVYEDMKIIFDVMKYYFDKKKDFMIKTDDDYKTFFNESTKGIFEKMLYVEDDAVSISTESDYKFSDDEGETDDVNSKSREWMSALSMERHHNFNISVTKKYRAVSVSQGEQSVLM